MVGGYDTPFGNVSRTLNLLFLARLFLVLPSPAHALLAPGFRVARESSLLKAGKVLLQQEPDEGSRRVPVGRWPVTPFDVHTGTFITTPFGVSVNLQIRSE